MKIVLPVAGKGTRLRPHTHTRAKSLVHVAGKPVLEHIINRLTPLDSVEFIFITDEHGEEIRQFMKERFPGLPCRYIVQQQKHGPAHAVGLAAPFVGPRDDLLIVFNDTIFDTDVTRVVSLSADCDGLVYSKEVVEYHRFGVNVVRDGLIVEMVEKPRTPVSRLAQVGLYYLKDGAGFMQYLRQSIGARETVNGEYYLPAVFMRMIRDGYRFKAPEIDAWLDCGTPETLLHSNTHLLVGRHHNHGEVKDSVLIEPVHIEKGAVVRGCILGPNVSIAAGSIVEGCILKNSIVNSNALINGMILSNSILGSSVHVIGPTRQMNIGDHSHIHTLE